MKDFPAWEWLSELLAQIVTFIFCAAFFGAVAGITYALIVMARDFKFL